MKTSEVFENYPGRIVFLSNFVSVSIYLLGLSIVYRLGLPFLIIFLVFILIMEFRLIKYHCTDCYYWGKTCGFGKGIISSLFFKKGDGSNFCSQSMSWKDMIPDLLITLIPFLTGLVLLIIHFDLILLFTLILLLFLNTTGNSFIRGKVTCNYCKQKEFGCPAEKLFNKAK
jgi:hypothetical protein